MEATLYEGVLACACMLALCAGCGEEQPNTQQDVEVPGLDQNPAAGSAAQTAGAAAPITSGSGAQMPTAGLSAAAGGPANAGAPAAGTPSNMQPLAGLSAVMPNAGTAVQQPPAGSGAMPSGANLPPAGPEDGDPSAPVKPPHAMGGRAVAQPCLEREGHRGVELLEYVAQHPELLLSGDFPRGVDQVGPLQPRAGDAGLQQQLVPLSREVDHELGAARCSGLCPVGHGPRSTVELTYAW